MPHELPKKLSEISIEKKDKPKQKKQFLENKKKNEGSAKGIITMIQSQKKKGRYNIYLDDTYAFPVDESLLVKYRLFKGMEVPSDLQKTLQQEDTTYKAYHRALHYLSYALRSTKEVKDDLKKKDFEEQIDDVIKLLEKHRLVDDLEYAKSYVRTSLNVNRKGSRVIRQELKRKGISEEEITEAMNEYNEEDKLANAIMLGEKMVNKSKRRSSKDTERKIKQHLLQKGYEMEIINLAIETIDSEKEEEDEMDALEIQGEKMWRRYSKDDMYKRKQKTKSNLFQKGFSGEMIQQFIDEKEMEEE
ncbi:recombination regulator RecX [Lacticigenium naphthae]|uniref:recombination regulator RecX n=1 Tax=Lacticigenium naphthae TaxID=515351 RepID=UPI0003FCB362|nr:recombination regulator RecX [Lacticigenium naphthae]